MNSKVALWMSSNDTGLSSRAIVAWLERDPEHRLMKGSRYNHPHDPADLGRCIRLLILAPEYRERLSEMAGASPQWARLVARWPELERLYWLGYPTGKAPQCYELMRKLIYDKA